MPSATLTMQEDTLAELEAFPWVNWSEVAREEFIKKLIFEEYMKTGKLSREHEEFCEEIDWHPVDELPLKKEFVAKLQKTIKGPHTPQMDKGEFIKWLNKL